LRGVFVFHLDLIAQSNNSRFAITDAVFQVCHTVDTWLTFFSNSDVSRTDDLGRRAAVSLKVEGAREQQVQY
jgi:hypothetical protein